MMGGSFIMRGRNVERSVVFINWEVENKVYSLTTVTRHRRVMTIGRFLDDGTIEESSAIGNARGRLIGSEIAVYEGVLDGKKVTQSLQRISDDRYQLIHELDGRFYPIDIDKVSNADALKLAARLYPAEFSAPKLEPVRRKVTVRPPPLSKTARSALVVGISNYSGLTDLPNPVNDARAIAQRLTSLGYKVELVIDPTKARMNVALARFRATIAESAGSPALFYYAGHAVEVQGKNFLLPADMPRQLDMNIEGSAIRLEEIVEHMPVTRNATRVIILDSCRSPPLRMAGVGRGLALFSAPEAMFIAYATAPGMVAADGDGTHSPFTQALIEQLRQPGQPIEAIFRRVRRSVLSATGGQQIPWDSSSLLEPFAFRD